MSKFAKYKKTYWIKEVIFLLLALISVGLFAYEEIANPNHAVLVIIDKIDLSVAVIFFLDYIHLLYKSNNKKLFLIHNWYLLLASIPLVNSWTEVLRGLRILRFIRIIRIGEHIEYNYMLKTKINKNK